MVISGACTINVLLALAFALVGDVSYDRKWHFKWNNTLKKNINNYLNSNIYSYLETSGVQSSNPYLNVLHFFNARVN